MRHLGPEGAKSIQKLENKLTEKKAYVFIVPGNGKFEPSSGRLGWDPRLASRNTNGTTQSPALVLMHELGHAFHWFDNPVAYSERADMKREDDYDNQEEYLTITGLETRMAISMGEGVRYNHRGDDYSVPHSDMR